MAFFKRRRNFSSSFSISSEEDLYEFQCLSSNDYRNPCRERVILTKDIYLDPEMSRIRPWKAINEFAGEFEGNGHCISGLFFDDPSITCVGFFGSVREGGIVSNLRIQDSYFSGDCYVAGIVGFNEGLVQNCSFSGTIKAQRYSGGIVGTNNSRVINCKNEGRVRVALCMGGGVVGQNQGYGYIEMCYNCGEVTGDHEWIGGIAGTCEGKMNRCFNRGKVSAKNEVGGIIGSHFSSCGICYDCRNFGSISGKGRVGGVIGYNNESGILNNCCNLGEVSGSEVFGAIAGSNIGTIRNCFYLINDKNVKGTGNAPDNNDIKAVEKPEMMPDEKYSSREQFLF